MGLFKKIFKGIGKAFKSVGKFINKAFQKFGKFMNKLGIFGQIGMALISWQMGGFIWTQLGKVATVATKALGTVGKALATWSPTLGRVGKIVLSGVRKVMQAGKFAKEVWSGTVGTITEAVGSVLKPTMQAAGEKLGMKFSTAVTQGAGGSGWTSTVARNLANVKENMVNHFWEAGNILKGEGGQLAEMHLNRARMAKARTDTFKYDEDTLKQLIEKPFTESSINLGTYGEGAIGDIAGFQEEARNLYLSDLELRERVTYDPMGSIKEQAGKLPSEMAAKAREATTDALYGGSGDKYSIFTGKPLPPKPLSYEEFKYGIEKPLTNISDYRQPQIPLEGGFQPEYDLKTFDQAAYELSPTTYQAIVPTAPEATSLLRDPMGDIKTTFTQAGPAAVAAPIMSAFQEDPTLSQIPGSPPVSYASQSGRVSYEALTQGGVLSPIQDWSALAFTNFLDNERNNNSSPMYS